MTSVFLLCVDIPYEGFAVLGVYSSKQKAITAKKSNGMYERCKDHCYFEPEEGYKMFVFEQVVDKEDSDS